MCHTLRYSALVLIFLCITGCTALWMAADGSPRQGVSGSLVDFIYPDGQQPPAFDGVVPTLKIPLRVGLAFVPSQSGQGAGLAQATKALLLEKVRLRFSEQDYIQHIQIISDTYLRGRKGFDALEQVSRMYSLDVIALVSYDQLAIADDRSSSFLYWTIVGAYVVKGSQNDVRTFVETAIFDVNTRKLLLSAPGVNELVSNSTLIELPEEMRKAREKSFSLAMDDMTTNLETELVRFKKRIKEDKSVLIAKRSSAKSRGASSVGTELVFALMVCLAVAWIRRRKLRS